MYSQISIRFCSLCLTLMLMTASGPANAEECQSVRVNSTTDWFPVIMRDPNSGALSGILFDVSTLLFAQMDVKISIQPLTPWKRLFPQMDQGGLDAILGVYWNSERAKKYSYSNPITQDDVAVFVRKGREDSFKDLTDLIGHTGVRPLGGSYGEEFDQFARQKLTIEQVPAEEHDRMINMVALGRVDYAVLAYYDGLSDIKRTGNQEKVVALSWPVAKNPVHILFSRQSPCADLVPELNRLIARMHRDGTIKDLEMKYLNPGS